MKAAATSDIADRRMNGAAPGRSRSMTPRPADDRKRDREDRRGGRVDDREEGARWGDVGRRSAWRLWSLDGCGSGESRWPHCPAATPAGSSTARRDPRGLLGALVAARPIPRVSVPEPSLRWMAGHPRGRYRSARPWNPSPGRAPPSPPARWSWTPRSRCSSPRSRSLTYLGGTPPASVLRARSSSTLLLLESLPLIVRRRYPLAVMARRLGRDDRPPRDHPGRPALQVGPRRSSWRRTPSASGSTAARRSPHGRHWAPRSPSCSSARAGIGAVLASLVQTELIFLVAWLVGDASRIRRLYAGTLEERAQHARARARRAGRARRARERERIARELHDVVTHHVSVIVIQAGGALRVIEKRPDEARTALEAIASTGRLALTDMRRMLGILGDQEASDPTPGPRPPGRAARPAPVRGLEWSSSSRATRGRSTRASPSPPTGSSRRRSRTRSSTRAAAARASSCATPPMRSRSPWTTSAARGAPSAVEPPHEGRGLIGMRERATMLARNARRAAHGHRVPRAAPACRSTARSRRHEHPRPARRRPAARPHRLPDDPRGRGGDRGRRRGGRWARGRRGRRAAPTRRRRDGHPDAGHGRRRGDAPPRPRPTPTTPSPRILVLTTFDTDEHVVEALRAGASGFLLKDVTPADFVAAIRIVASGEALIAPSVTRRLLERFAQAAAPADPERDRRARPADRARARGPRAGRAGPVEPRDRGAASSSPSRR